MPPRKTSSPKGGPKKSPTDSDVIEGVAVEKPAADDQSPESSKTKSSRASQSDAEPDKASSDSDNRSQSGRHFRSGSLVAVALAGTAILIAAAGLFLQRQASNGQEAFSNDIARIEDRLAASQSGMEQIKARLAMLQTQAAQLAEQIDQIASIIPADQTADIVLLQERIDALETGIVELTDAAAKQGATRNDIGPGAGSANVQIDNVVMTRAALGAVTAMTTEATSGGSPELWFEALQSLSEAGLELGDLDNLSGLLVPPPPSHAALFERAGLLLPEVKVALRKQAGSDSWWQATAGRLSDFITLRSAESNSSGQPSDSAAFLSALRDALRDADLAEFVTTADSLILTGDLAADTRAAQDLKQLLVDAKRRLQLDGQLASFAARLTADLAVQLSGGGN